MKRVCGLVLCFALTACGPNATSDDPFDPNDPNDPNNPNCTSAECQNHCPPGEQTVLRGRVLAPNGVDPIPGALVYVPRQINEFPEEVQCEVCDQITDDAIVITSTDVDGSFTLAPIPTSENQTAGITVPVMSQIGRFRKMSNVVIDSPCAENQASDDNFQLPSRTEGQDSIPKIAVVTGDFDVMECVLLNMGIDQDAFDLYNGISDPIFGGGTPNTEGPFDTLLTDVSKMKKYNVIFINCSANEFESHLMDANVRDNIENYVLSGGRLYVTDWSYDYIEQIEEFSPLIDFGPGQSDGNPEPVNGAAMGDGGITTEAFIHDDEMAAWLEAVERATGEEIISDGRTVHIEHFLISWVMQYAASMSNNVRVWLTGEVSGGGLSGDLPLTTTFDYESCGRVLYSSYHTLGRDGVGTEPFPSYCTSTQMSPQERVLMYLILHISDCITID